MATREVFRVNSPRVIFENIDGELIMVHMEKGAYFTTDDVGAVLWELIDSGCSMSEMCRSLAARYQAAPEEIEAAVATFIERLTAEDLVSQAEPIGERTPPATPVVATRAPFHPPQLHTYRDMQDMLALDPIHDVEAAGWPVPKADDDSRLESGTG